MVQLSTKQTENVKRGALFLFVKTKPKTTFHFTLNYIKFYEVSLNVEKKELAYKTFLYSNIPD